MHRNTLRPLYTMGLGLMSFFLFVILVVTGILLMFYYVPSTTQAYDRMLDLRGTVAFGTFLRNMHRWSAHGMVAIVFLHMCRVFFTGSYKKPREFNWVLGVVLFLLTLFMSFTGYLLALGPAGVLGDHGRHLHRRLRPRHRQGHQVPAAGRYHRRPGSAAALLCAARGRAARDPDAPDRDSLLAHSQGRRPVAPRRSDLRNRCCPAAIAITVKASESAQNKLYGLQGFVRGPFTKLGNVPDNAACSPGRTW